MILVPSQALLPFMQAEVHGNTTLEKNNHVSTHTCLISVIDTTNEIRNSLPSDCLVTHIGKMFLFVI